MPDYAVIDAATRLVVNVIVWQPGISEGWTPRPGEALIQEEGGGIGWLYIEGEGFVTEEDPRHPAYVAPED